MTEVRWERYPLIHADPLACGWLQIQADLGLAANTIEAYGRALQDYLSFSSQLAVVPETAGRAHVAAYVRELTTRPSPGGSSVRVLDLGAGWPTPHSSNDWSWCVCFMTISSKKAFVPTTRWDADATRRAKHLAAPASVG
jgi:hypothetical protein